MKNYIIHSEIKSKQEEDIKSKNKRTNGCLKASAVNNKQSEQQIILPSNLIMISKQKYYTLRDFHLQRKSKV